MDTGLQIKDLAAEIKVTNSIIISWEIRGMKP
jgi:ribosome-binding protein aMBF1 (putative translation factor)